ncbi:hypothetical protein AGMMS4952_26110 [Spirochaetia bacterium]|nr:hypothetical protein AGMMS4952_26110 [Spirochaetia bacterium]
MGVIIQNVYFSLSFIILFSFNTQNVIHNGIPNPGIIISHLSLILSNAVEYNIKHDTIIDGIKRTSLFFENNKFLFTMAVINKIMPTIDFSKI